MVLPAIAIVIVTIVLAFVGISFLGLIFPNLSLLFLIFGAFILAYSFRNTAPIGIGKNSIPLSGVALAIGIGLASLYFLNVPIGSFSASIFGVPSLVSSFSMGDVAGLIGSQVEPASLMTIGIVAVFMFFGLFFAKKLVKKK